MGAEQSSARGNTGQGTPAKRCYYEVLDVTPKASDDEIKKAYRKKALELHPDRNYGDVENATIKFAEVQSAYEVLSDPQERAWYDSHRDAILRGDDLAEDHFEHNLRVTTADEIVSLMGRFNAKIPFTDASDGFYGMLNEKFRALAAEEDAACDWEGLEPINYPDFGHMDDSYEPGVKLFYSVWMNFTTKKSFAWKDAYRPSDAPDRATRRLIEKENRKLRDEGIREFNDAVRSLVAFVRKRDKRYVPNAQSETERQKVLRDAVAAQAARSRAAFQAKLSGHVVPDWIQSSDPLEEDEFVDSEESVQEEIECVVCGKTFKSEKQYEAHEKSKKHIKAVQQLKREMQKEDKLLNLDKSEDDLVIKVTGFGINEKGSQAESVPNMYSNKLNKQSPGDNLADKVVDNNTAAVLDEKNEDDINSGSAEEDEYAPREAVESRLAAALSPQTFSTEQEVNQSSAVIDDPIAVDSDDITPQKVGKAKAKRAKKAARQLAEEQEGQQFRCIACNESFPSKTKLFNHIKEENHATPVPRSGKVKIKQR
ncbi:putative DnaJ like protein subfamily C member 21 [Xylogone sp. PMI_703]|nr:putative DnaJ like protein subfamily C member 21 [Xylogone sp. PMI_703]